MTRDQLQAMKGEKVRITGKTNDWSKKLGRLDFTWNRVAKCYEGELTTEAIFFLAGNDDLFVSLGAGRTEPTLSEIYDDMDRNPSSIY